MSSNSEADNIESRVVKLLQNAIYATNETEKVSFLNQAQEFLIHHDILDNFLEEILGFQNDRFAEVRKFVAGFIEATCKKEPDYFPKVIVNLSMMLADEVPNVLKRVIQALTQLYKIFLTWVSSAKINDEIESTWEAWNQIKNQVFSLIDLTENDGVRTQCIKFIEMVIVCQTSSDNFSKEDFSIDQIEKVRFESVNIKTLEEEAKQLFEQLINFQSKIHISSVNLMTTMQSLALIAKERSKLFFNKVVRAFEHLSLNFPPTLAKSQVNSVNKQLKLLAFMLLKHPYVQFAKNQFHLTQTLLNIGVKQNEINRCLQENKKRGIKVDQSASKENTKRIKVEVDDDDEEMMMDNNGAPIEEQQPADVNIKYHNLDNCLNEIYKKFSRYDAIKAADITAKDLIGRLNDLNVVCDLVLSSLHQLPDDLSMDSVMPLKEFSLSLNDPIVIAKKMAFYLTGSGIGPGIDEVLSKYVSSFEQQYRIKVDGDLRMKIAALLRKSISKEMKNQQQSHHKVKLVQSGKSMTSAVKIKQLKLEDITKPFDLKEKVKQIEKCVQRVLAIDRSGHISAKQSENYKKILGKFSIEFYEIESVKCLIKEYVFADLRSRYEILFNAIYSAYIQSKMSYGKMDFYYKYLYWVFETIIDVGEPNDRDFFLQKFCLESPVLDDNVIALFKTYVRQSEDFETSGSMIKMLIEKRPANRAEFLAILLEVCTQTDKSEVQESCLRIIQETYQCSGLNLKPIIEQFALKCLNRLTDEETISDGEIKKLLSIYLRTLPLNPKLIHKLPDVYVSSNASIKRCILRLIQEPIQEIDMNSPELVTFVKNCLDGAETLVSRVISILTEKQSPTAQLVACVKDLYQKRVSDVRFLIPVLRGLSKREIIEILPQLIKLNPFVVKEVINRLFMSHDSNGGGGGGGGSFKNPLKPADLLIALHNIDTSKCDLKTIIKTIQLCFEEKTIFTSEVLAVVMQILIEQKPLPTLLMRTVIQALSHYPRLSGIVMNNILQRLILKQVWNQKKVWEGFIKCCQRTLPQSFRVLLQLPAAQLESVLEQCPEIRPALKEYIQQSGEQKLSMVPQSLLDVIFATTNDNNNSDLIDDNTARFENA